jgi:hypothetical protein
MPAKKTISILIALSAIFIILLAAGCASNQQQTQETGASSDDQNRAVTPEVDWSLQDIQNAQNNDEENNQNPDGGKKPADSDSGSGGPPTEEFPVPGDVVIEVYADGELLPEGTPVSVYPGQETDLRFHLTATGAELAQYSIVADTIINIPQEGRLSGYEADVDYSFTFNLDTWREGGITITVVNRSATTFTRNVPVYPAPMPGINPE